MKTAPEVAAWLKKLKPDELTIVKALQKTIHQIIPEPLEFIYHNALVSARTRAGSDWITYISVFANHINLSFFYGSALPDPEKLLIGNGKRIRHIKIISLKDATHPAVKTLVEHAFKNVNRNFNKSKND